MLSYKQIMSDEYQGKLRKATWEQMCAHGRGYIPTAREITISPTTLHKFIEKEEPVAWRCFLKILKWVEEKGGSIK